MSINIKMNSYDMCVSVKLSNEDEDYEVNTSGFFRTLDDFLSKLELYENVDIEIKRETPSVTQEYSNTVSVSVSGNQSDLFSFDNNMNRG